MNSSDIDVMTPTMRDIYRTCQRHMSRSPLGRFTGIIPHMPNMLKTHILERVERRMKALGISERSLGMQALNKPDIVRGWRVKDALPRLDTLVAIARVLDTTPEWLAYGVDSDAQRIPLISWVSAGSFGDTDIVTSLSDLPSVTTAGLPLGEWYALKVVGDSMDRISPPDSIIFVDRQDKELVANGCYILQDGEGGATYKRYRPSPDRFEPVSTNKDHEPLFPDQGNMPEIFGRVHRSIIDM